MRGGSHFRWLRFVGTVAGLASLCGCERLERPALHVERGGVLRTCGKTGSATVCAEALLDRWKGRGDKLYVTLASGTTGEDFAGAAAVAGQAGFGEAHFTSAGTAGSQAATLVLPGKEPRREDWALLEARVGDAAEFQTSPLIAKRADGSEVIFEWIRLGTAVEWRNQRLGVEDAAQASDFGADTYVTVLVTPDSSAEHLVILLSDLDFDPSHLLLMLAP